MADASPADAAARPDQLLTWFLCCAGLVLAGSSGGYRRQWQRRQDAEREPWPQPQPQPQRGGAYGAIHPAQRRAARPAAGSRQPAQPAVCVPFAGAGLPVRRLHPLQLTVCNCNRLQHHLRRLQPCCRWQLCAKRSAVCKTLTQM